MFPAPNVVRIQPLWSNTAGESTISISFYKRLRPKLRAVSSDPAQKRKWRGVNATSNSSASSRRDYEALMV